MKFLIDRSGFLVHLLLAGLTGLLGAGAAQAATISAPASSATGAFTVSWSSGYELRLADVQWRVAGPPAKSFSFSGLPPGAYRFVLASCAWSYSWELGYVYACGPVPASARTVTVTGSAAPVVEDWTAEAGNAPYQADVSPRGAARINVPLRTPAGVNGVALDLSLAYDSARGGDRARYVADDVLGYGWSLQGVPYVHRCRVGQPESTDGGGLLTMTASDPVCLDGEPLTLVAGIHWRAEAEYRAASNPDLKITLRSSLETGLWFEVRYPDGAVGRFGDNPASRVAGSGRIEYLSQEVTPNETYIWGLRKLTGALGAELTVGYQRFDGYGQLQPESIVYGGAEVRFSYGPRTDLPAVALDWASQVRRLSVLNGVRIRMNGKPIREYRLASSPDASGRLRLERIQACGYDRHGGSVSCLPPLRVQWAAVAGGALHYPIAVSELTDGLGARTGFSYAAITATSNPLGYPEAPFGALMSDPNTTGTGFAAVAEVRLSDGKTADGFRRWTYRYKGQPQRSTRNHGFAGFHEVRSTDQQSGVVSYTQARLDWPFIGSVSQIRSFDAAFGSHSHELAREEHGYAQKVHANGARHAYRARSTRWLLEGGVVVGGATDTVSFCYRPPSGDTCPLTGPEQDSATQRRVVSTAGNALSSSAFTPAFWGDVPVRGVASQTEKRVITEVTDLGNTALPWVRGVVTRRSVTHSVPGQPIRTVTENVAYLPGSTVVRSSTRFPGDAQLERTVSRSFDSAAGHALSAETVQGANVAPRSWRFATPYQDGRYVAQATNPLGQTSSRSTDDRFGQPAERVDADGRATTIDYDPFGRVVREVGAEGTEVVTTYERCDQADCAAVSAVDAALKVTVLRRNGSTQTAPTRVTYFDVLGREVLEEVEGLDAASGWRSRRTGYDDRSRVQYVSRPAVGNPAPACSAAGSECTWFTYDRRDRVVREERPDGGSTTTAYSGAGGLVTVLVSETIRTPGMSDTSRSTRSTYDVLGFLTQTTDAYGSASAVTTAYTRDSHGNLIGVVVAGVPVATLEYDLAGNRTKLIDASSGTTDFTFNALGELVRTKDAKGQASTYEYDGLGRLVRRVDPVGVTHAWTWDPAGATGRLAARSRPGFAESYSYDADHGRLVRIDSQVNVTGVWSGAHSRVFAYDAAGRLASQQYPNGQLITYRYASSGQLNRVLSDGTALHDWRALDGFGNPTDELFHDGAFRTSKTHDASTGRLTRIETGTPAAPRSIQDLETVWRTSDSLYRRVDRRDTATSADDYVDTFNYDAMERLLRQSSSSGASRALDFGYGANGNLASKTSSAAGDLRATGYVYGGADVPYRLTSVTLNGVANTLSHDANGNIVHYAPAQGPQTWLRYDARNNVTRITVGPDENLLRARDEFWYDPDGSRFLSRETWDDAGVERTRQVLHLGGDYEDVQPPAGAPHDRVQRIQVTPVVRQVRRRDAHTQVWEVFHEYVHRDHLGSVDVINDASGAVVDRASFDPFGTRRAANRAGDLATGELSALLERQDGSGSRGFTGHEHRDRTGFVHMNGRVYDPRIGRFVTPDPMVQAPGSSQSYNRYAYVFNNPLSYTDPSGFCGSQEGFQLTPCKGFDEHVQVFGSGGGGGIGYFGGLNTAGGGILTHGPAGIGAIGGGVTLPDLGTLVADLQARLAADSGDAEAARRPLEVISVTAPPGPGQDPGDRTAGWLAHRLASLDGSGLRSLFGTACVGVVLGGCGAVALQTSNGMVHLMLVMGVIPGAGISFGTESVLFSSDIQASSGYGTAVLVTGGFSGIGGSLGLVQGTNGFNVTGAAGYGFGLGGGVGFYYAAPVGSIGR